MDKNNIFTQLPAKHVKVDQNTLDEITDNESMSIAKKFINLIDEIIGYKTDIKK